MKRFFAIIITAALLCSMSGCTQGSGDPGGSASGPASETLAMQMSHSYRAQEILTEESLGFTKFYQFGEKILTCTPATVTTMVLGIYSPDTGEFIRKEFEYADLIGVSVQGEQVEVLLKFVDYDTWELTYLLKVYDSSLNEISSEDVTEIWKDCTPPGSWAKDTEGNAYMPVEAGGILCRKTDGSTAIIPDTNGFSELYTGRDGAVYAIFDHRAVKRLTPESAQEIPLELPKVGGNYGELLPCSTQYDALCYTTEYLYGMNFSDGSAETLMSWQESDFTITNNRNGTHLLPDGRILLSASDDLTAGYDLYLLTARTQEEVDSMKLITLGDVTNSDIDSWVDKFVCKYNRQAEGCRIVTKAYWDENAADLGLGQLEQDLLDGNVPDILCSIPNYRMFSNKGMFEDLGVWMENDPDFHEDDYFMNFFDALRYKGRLECIGFRFAVNTYMAKTEFLDGAERLTLADYADLELPEGMELLSSADRASAMDILLRSQLGEFVDYENATCSFNSEEFISLLEWFGSFPETAAIQDDYAYRENRALLYPVQISGLQDYHNTVQCWFDNADVTLTGTPLASEGNGGVFATLGLITVSSTAEHKEEIWDFIKFCLSEEVQSSGGVQSYGIPVNRNALENIMELQLSGTEKLPSNSFGDEMIQLTPPTQAEADELQEYLNGVTFCSYLDDFVTDIVREETDKFFAGDCTAEDAARVIQSRVSLYLAEQG